MNIVLLLNNDIASNFALNLLLPALKTHSLQIFLSSKVGGNSAKPEALKELTTFEQQGIYQAIAQKKTSVGKLVENTINFKTYAEITQQDGIAIDDLNEINSPAGVARIKALAPDLIISIRFGVILKKPVIELAKHGVINLHSGLLPDYRGVMATFWALLNGDEQLSTSLHFIADSTIDTGGIIAHSTIPVDRNKSYLWHVLALYVGGCRLIEQTMKSLVKGDDLPTTDQSDEGKYYTFPNVEDISRFNQKCGALYQQQEIIELINQGRNLL